MTKPTDKPTPGVMDLSALDMTKFCNNPVRVELKHPITNAPLGIFISVLGKDSDTFREHLRTTVNEKSRKAAMAARRGKEVEPETLEQAEAQGVDLLIVCTVGWENVTFEGEDLEFNVPNARRVYSKLRWIRGQVDNAVDDLELFMNRS